MSRLLPTGAWPEQVLVGDLNGDGRADLLYLRSSSTGSQAYSSQSDSVGVYLQGAGRLFTPMTVSWSDSLRLHVAVLGDFRGVGKQDVIIASAQPASGSQTYRLHIDHLLNDGAGALTTGPVALDVPALGPAEPFFGQLLMADFDGDGKLDLLTADTDNGYVYVLLNNGDGTFRQGSATLLPQGVGQIRVGDVDGDGITDVLTSQSASVNTVTLLHGNGDGTLRQSATIALPLNSYAQNQMLYADVDGDGLPDLLIGQLLRPMIVYPGTQSGLSLGAPQSLTVNGLPGGTTDGEPLAVADMDGDGRPDLIWYELPGPTPLGNMSVLKGVGQATFEQGPIIDPGPAPYGSVIAADVDGDGVLDVAFGSIDGIGIRFGSLASLVTPAGTVTASPEPSLYGGAVSLTLNLQTAAGNGTPTGTVAFAVDGVSVGTATVSQGSATLPLSTFPGAVGSHTISASYSGDATYAAATFTGTHVVQGLPSVTTVTNLVTPIFYGQEIGYTNGIDAQVTASPAPGVIPPAGAPTAGGEVYVYIDGALLCELLEGGTGPNGGPQRCNDAAFLGFAAGQHIMMAAYQGNSYFAPSTSPTYGVTILPDATMTTLGTSGSPSTAGSPVTFTAVVSAPYATPTGPVTFLDGATVLGSGTLNGGGVATLTTSSLAVGTHTLSAQYGATQNFNASASGPVTQVVLNASTVLLRSSLNPSVYGQAVTFTATVFAGAGASSVPAAGSVIFNDGGVVFGGVVTLDAQGNAAVTTSALSVAQHNITAVYAGNAGTAGAISVPVLQKVTLPVPAGFTLKVDPGSFSVGVGDSATALVTVTPLGSFNQPVTLSCSGLPNESTCTFAETVVPSGGGVTQLTVHVEAPHNCGSTQQYFVAGSARWWLGGLGAMTLLFGLRARRRVRGVAVLMALLCLVPMLGGCGTGNCTDLATKPGTYTFVVTGVATGSVNETQSVTVPMVAHL